MAAPLHNPPLIQYKNLIRLLDSFHPVCDHNQSFSGGQDLDCLLQLRLVLGVNIGRGLVQNDDRSGSMARALERLWRAPPEIVGPLAPMMVAWPSGRAVMKSWHRAAFAAATTSSWVASGLPNLMLFSMLSLNRYTR